ncbi:hypothetical protein, partial [Streptomyces sp. NPDC002547]
PASTYWVAPLLPRFLVQDNPIGCLSGNFGAPQPVGRRADLVEYRNMLVAIRNRVADLKGRGLTVEQTIAAKPTQPFDAKWGQGIIGPDLFTKLVYRGV